MQGLTKTAQRCPLRHSPISADAALVQRLDVMNMHNGLHNDAFVCFIVHINYFSEVPGCVLHKCKQGGLCYFHKRLNYFQGCCRSYFFLVLQMLSDAACVW